MYSGNQQCSCVNTFSLNVNKHRGVYRLSASYIGLSNEVAICFMKEFYLFPGEAVLNVTKRKRFSKVYYNLIQFPLHLFEVSKLFKNHYIRYLLTFPRISVSDFKIAYKRRYPNLTFSHVFLFELIYYMFKFHPQIS